MYITCSINSQYSYIKQKNICTSTFFGGDWLEPPTYEAVAAWVRLIPQGRGLIVPWRSPERRRTKLWEIHDLLWENHHFQWVNPL